MTLTPEAPFSEDELALLAAERERPGPTPEARALLRARLASVAAGGAGVTATASAAPDGPEVASRAGLLGAARRLAALAFVAGGVVGGGAVYAVMRPAHAPEPAVAPQPSEAPTTLSTAHEEPAPSPHAPTTPVPPRDHAPAATSKAAPSSPAPVQPSASATHGAEDEGGALAERRLVERARSALARGDYDACLAAADAHAARYRDGTLAEEREALAVQALARAGRTREAAERGGRFRKSYPDSLLRSVVDAALAIPQPGSDR